MENRWEIGEKEFLLSLHRRLGNIGLGWRDDCIERRIDGDLSLVYSIDSMNRKLSHNKSDDVKAFGRWAAAVISNDVVACGVRPRGLALDIGVNLFNSEDEIYGFVEGVLEVCTQYNMDYEGGNLSSSSYISGVSWGISEPDAIIHRDGARDNSILIATAPIGVGWAIELLRTVGDLKQAHIPAELVKTVDFYKENPVINMSAFQEIWNLKLIECGMDLSDGIIEFGYEIYDRTGLGVVFHPQDPHKIVEFVASLLHVDPEDIMYEPGYDTPLAHGWCIKKENINTVLAILKKYKVPYTIMGDVCDTVSGVYRKRGDALMPLPRYWDDKMKDESRYDSWLKNILGIEKENKNT